MRAFEFEDIRNHCLQKAHVSEGFPFDARTCVWKVDGKVFALADIERFDGVTLKCDPIWALELREAFAGVTPGWHANKKHWNTVQAESDVPLRFVLQFIDHSYECVIAGFSKRRRTELSL
jgi:predicted DNA-binding protein (MmcQ/YjbR family)